MKRIILTTAAFAAVILLVPAANAADTMWQSSGGWSGDWNDPAHWTGGVPNSGMTAELPTSSGTPYTVTVNTAFEACKTLTMHSDATLDVSTGDELEIGNVDGQFSTIDGTIKLSTSTSVLRFVNSHTVFGDGVIDGQDDSALIEITTGKTLTNAMTIEGHCQIVPVGGAGTTFTNNGIVHANIAGGILAIAPDTLAGSGIWQVSTYSNATLRFTTGSSSLTGSFIVRNGKLDIDASVTTTGNLLQTGGTIDVASTKTFSAS